MMVWDRTHNNLQIFSTVIIYLMNLLMFFDSDGFWDISSHNVRNHIVCDLHKNLTQICHDFSMIHGHKLNYVTWSLL